MFRMKIKMGCEIFLSPRWTDRGFALTLIWPLWTYGPANCHALAGIDKQDQRLLRKETSPS